MKKIESYADFEVQKVYNIVYNGLNKAYGKANGKQTILITSLSPLRAQVLFCPFGSLYDDDLRSGEITYSYPEKAFAEYDLFEPENESEWFIKSQRAKTITAAIEQGLLTKERVSGRAIPKSGIVGHTLPPVTDADGEKKYPHFHSYRFSVEKHTKFPWLECVYITWDNYTDLVNELKLFGSIIEK